MIICLDPCHQVSHVLFIHNYILSSDPEYDDSYAGDGDICAGNTSGSNNVSQSHRGDITLLSPIQVSNTATVSLEVSIAVTAVDIITGVYDL